MDDWKKIDAYHWQNDAGYRVSETGPDADKVYTAWAPREHAHGYPLVIGYFRLLADAKRCAERHAEKAA